MRHLPVILASVALGAGCIDEGKYQRDNAALREQVEAERSGASRARASSGRLRAERDAWQEKLARLESDIARLRGRMQSAPNASTDAGGQRRAAAIRQLDALQGRASDLRKSPPVSEADAQAMAKREAELTQLKWDKEDLERGLKEYADLLGTAPDPNAPAGGTQ